MLRTSSSGATQSSSSATQQSAEAAPRVCASYQESSGAQARQRSTSKRPRTEIRNRCQQVRVSISSAISGSMKMRFTNRPASPPRALFGLLGRSASNVKSTMRRSGFHGVRSGFDGDRSGFPAMGWIPWDGFDGARSGFPAMGWDSIWIPWYGFPGIDSIRPDLESMGLWMDTATST